MSQKYLGVGDWGGRYGERQAASKASHERCVGVHANIGQSAYLPAHCDEDTKYDPDQCRERDGLQEHAEAGGGEKSLGTGHKHTFMSRMFRIPLTGDW
jgi:hypothetical protein